MIRINTELVLGIEEIIRKTDSSPIEELTFAPGEYIAYADKRWHAVYIVKQGVTKCFLTEDTGKDFIQEFFSVGQIFGEVEMFNGEASFCSIQSITNTTVYKIPVDYFQKLIETDKKINQLLLSVMAQKIRFKALRHAYHQSHTLNDNLFRLEQQLPNWREIITKRDMANYLGITERSLNRALQQMDIDEK